MKGRKPKSKQEKIIKGSFRQHRENKSAPEPSTEKMLPPHWLPLNCHELFYIYKGRYEAHGQDSASWTETVAMMAMRTKEIQDCTQTIELDGGTYKSEVSAGDPIINEDGEMFTPVKVLIKGHPAVKQRSDAMRHLQSLISESCLSVASVSKAVNLDTGKPKEKDPWDKLG